MGSASSRSQHRHYKTLILLVLSMTCGTFFLYWLAQLSPVTPLAATRLWNRIAVRAEPTSTPDGFYHLRIDDAGRLFQSDAWRDRRAHPGSPRTIHVLLTASLDGGATEAQARVLSHTLADLGQEFGITNDQVQVARSASFASAESSSNLPRLRGS